VISFTLCAFATITSCPSATNCRLTHGEWVPTSSATRLDGIFPNNESNPPFVIGNDPSLTTSPASSKMQ
jgi:hypothetical protein